MKERPIIFSCEMIKAILDGRKTQTRRNVHKMDIKKMSDDGDCHPSSMAAPSWCPYGQSGDRLWVQETWGTGTRPCQFNGCRDGIEYKADELFLEEGDELTLYPLPKNIEAIDDNIQGWRPAKKMPRWASRITLEIVAVRVERLQEISETDARAEGFHSLYAGLIGLLTARWNFSRYWDFLHKKDNGWEDNPFVWVIEFKKVQA